MAIYVCSDIHGRLSKYEDMISYIKLKSTDHLYILGDVCDRGPNSLKIYEHIRENENITLIKGNHEELLIDYYDGIDEYNNWIRNGGISTHLELEERDNEYKKSLIEYLRNLPKFIIIDKFLLVHAGLNVFYENTPLETALENSIDTDALLWNRSFFPSIYSVKDYTVIMGHSRVQSFGRNSIMFNKNKILIDCGCSDENGRLACLRLDDMEEFYF